MRINCAKAQDNDVKFLKNAIKESYAGYKDKINDAQFDNILKRLKRNDEHDTFKLLSAIADYFKDQHLKVYRFNTREHDTISGKENAKIVTTYLSNGKMKDNKEGYWINDYNNCIIALKMNSNKPKGYKAYIVESRKEAIPVGTVVADLVYLKNNEFLTDFTTPKGGFSYYLVSKFRNDSIFTTAPSGKWRKIENYKGNILSSLPEYNYVVSAVQLDKDNYLITIPGNTEENTILLDSIVKAQYHIISSTKNLIIDIRNNLGGTVRTYAPLFPFIYTNPIQKISGYRYYSQAMLDAEQAELKEYKKQKYTDTSLVTKKEIFIAKIKSNLGKALFDTGSVIKFDSIKSYPQNVAIIANYACYSASEMMILDFKQSKKVKVFGEHTFGAVDYLDDFSIDLPSNKYVLDIASFKRAIPKAGSKIDGVGIQPDVSISDTVKDWVHFVQSYYAK